MCFGTLPRSSATPVPMEDDSSLPDQSPRRVFPGRLDPPLIRISCSLHSPLIRNGSFPSSPLGIHVLLSLSLSSSLPLGSPRREGAVAHPGLRPAFKPRDRIRGNGWMVVLMPWEIPTQRCTSAKPLSTCRSSWKHGWVGWKADGIRFRCIWCRGGRCGHPSHRSRQGEQKLHGPNMEQAEVRKRTRRRTEESTDEVVREPTLCEWNMD